MVTPSKSITSCPRSKEGAMRETIYSCYIDIVTIRKQPGRLVAQVRMTRATLLRSRMNGNVHVRFCSRVGVATSRLRQRLDGSTSPGKDPPPGHVGPDADEPTSLRALATRV